MLPKQAAESAGFGVERGHEAATLQGLHGNALPRGRHGSAGHLQAGRQDVDHVSRLPSSFAAGRDAAGPVGDQRRGDAPLVNVVLEPPQRRVLQPGPALAAKPRRVGLRGVAHGAACRPALGVATVVAQEQDQGVVEQAAVAEAGHEGADGAIHEMDGGGIGGHQVGEPQTLRLGNLVPCGYAYGPPGRRLIAGEQPRRHLPLKPPCREGVPAGGIGGPEAFDLCGRRLERKVRRIVGEVEEEGLANGPRVVDEPQPELRPEVGRVPVRR